MTRLFLCAFICPVLILGCSTFEFRADPQTPHFTGGTIINTGPRHCHEPPGIVFSARRGTLFAVDDEGTICELQLDGTLVNKKRINRADLEGITIDPATGLLYAIKEHASYLLPGKNQDGITLDSEGHLYIAEDSGDIIKYTFDATIKP